ncbi:MAG: amino acid ABC transporter permease [Lactobacillales bacterium]|nr:amino acid ABC transporter permease [Lactobacillales bacterium]
MNYSFSFLPKYLPYFVDGAVVTVLISFLVVFFGVIIGTIMALCKLSKNVVLKTIANVYIEILRGTPMLLQLSIAFVIVKLTAPTITMGVLKIDFSLLLTGVIALSMNSGAYVAEIIRGGINAVNIGQNEAASSLGLRPTQTMRYVILPQAARNVLPALGNEFITVIKDSSLLAGFGVFELYYGTKAVTTVTYQSLTPLLFAGLFYFVMTFITSRLLKILEKKLEKGYSK